MGQARLEVVVTGNHGCRRDLKDGSTVTSRCGQPDCVDCLSLGFVEALRSKGASVESAMLTHWPGQSGQVRDDLLSGLRSGSF